MSSLCWCDQHRKTCPPESASFPIQGAGKIVFVVLETVTVTALGMETVTVIALGMGTVNVIVQQMGNMNVGMLQELEMGTLMVEMGSVQNALHSGGLHHFQTLAHPSCTST